MFTSEYEQLETALPDLTEKLRNGCLRGDPGSQKKLYQSFYGFALAICLRYCNDRDEAVEVMNTGFLKVLTHLDKYNPSKPFKPWLSRVMTNTAIDHYRSQLKFAYMADLSEAEEITTEASIDQKLNYEDLLKLVQRLPPGYRTVFNLYAIDGYSHEEIGKKLGISEGTSKSNLFKARQKLRNYLEEELKTPKIIPIYGDNGKINNEEAEQKPDRSVFQAKPGIAGPGI
ncbi:MAG TPA: sigma-70 family RNA polymerase sigma factor [Daejeonella sp.]|nr:sigma-70 family RNA polymerase sigma factor [Daejeonella sp.]